MPTSEFPFFVLRTLLNGQYRSSTTARQGYDQGYDSGQMSGGDRNTRRNIGYGFASITGLDDKVIKSTKIRVTTGSQYGTVGEIMLKLYHMKHTYNEANTTKLEPQDFYPQRDQDAAGAKIYDGTEIGTIGRGDTQTYDLPEAHFNAARAGYGLCFYNRGIASTPTSSEYAKEVIEAVIIVEWEEPYSAVGAPTAASLSASLSEGNVTGSWSGAKAGNSNAITGYEIQYREKTKSGSYGAWTAYSTVQSSATSGSVSLAPPSTRGNTREYRIRTLGAAGSAYYSGYVSMGTVKRNEAPTAPTAFTAGPVIYESGNVTLAFSGATDGDSNIAKYVIQQATKPAGGSYGSWTNLKEAPSSPATDTPSLARGNSKKYRIQAVDAFNVVSAWKDSNEITRNKAPATPTITYPGTSKTTYNRKPYFGLTITADPEGQALTLLYSIDSGSEINAGAVTAGSKKLQIQQLSYGSHVIKFWVRDALGAVSSVTQRTINVVQPAFGRTISASTLLNDTAGGYSGSKDIAELLAMINILRSYYGLGAATISRSTKHFHTWMQNMDDMWQYLRDTTNQSGAAMPTKITKARNAPSAAVINQLRGILSSL